MTLKVQFSFLKNPALIVLLICLINTPNYWQIELPLKASEESPLHFSSNSQILTNLKIINGNKIDDVELNRSIEFVESTFTKFNTVYESANQIPHLNQSYKRNHFVRFYDSDLNISPKQALGLDLESYQSELLWFVGHSPELTYSKTRTLNENYLDGTIPWPGKRPANISDVSKYLKNKNKNKFIFYLAPTCFSEKFHLLAIENSNTCGITNARWNRVSIFNKNEGLSTSKHFFESIEKSISDLDYDFQTNLFEAYFYTFKNDYLNYPNVSLSSHGFIRNTTLKTQISNEKFEPWNKDYQSPIWNRLYLEIRENKINPSRICQSIKENAFGQTSIRPLFSKSDLNLLPEKIKNQFMNLLSDYCNSNKMRLLTLDSLYEAERLSSEIRSFQALYEECARNSIQKKLNLSLESIQSLIAKYKKITKSYTKYYQPNEENCNSVSLLSQNIADQIYETTIINSDGLSPLPLILEFTKIIHFLKDNKANEIQKEKLLNILKCESQIITSSY